MTEASPGQPAAAWGALRRALPIAFPALIVAVGAYWTLLAGYRETFAILGRDPGIFQYVAWAIGRGERDDIDIREINGPLPHLIHMVLMRLGGGDEHVFRTLDLAAEMLVFAFAGALLPGVGRRAGARVQPAVRVAWGAAAAVVLTAQYLVHDWWQTAQRESFYDLFLIASLAVQLYAQTPASPTSRRVPLLALAGALSAITF